MLTFEMSERAVFERLDQRLREDGQSLHRCPRTSHDWPTHGDYYICAGTVVVRYSVDLEALALELGVLGEFGRLQGRQPT
jgi:hypothetical protein